MRRLLFALTLALLPGCDVATAALVLSAKDKSSSDDGAPVIPPTLGFGSPIFQAWTAQIADAAAATAAQTAIMDADGNPPLTTWTLIGNAAATAVFDPIASPASINAILIQVSSDENYQLDGIEILDSSNIVIAHATGTTWSNLVDFPDEFIGVPDGVSAVTTAVGATRAFIFSLYTGPIDRFRINLQRTTQPPAPGDVRAVATYTSGGNERPGGMAIDSAGLIHLTLSVGDIGNLVRYDMAGVFQDEVEITSDLATAGTHSVALNSVGDVFTSASIQGGSVQVRKFDLDLAPTGVAGFSSGLGSDRVEHNSITVDSAGFPIVVGGMSSLLSGRNHWRIKLPATVSGTPVWQDSTQLDGTNATTYWHAVTTDANNEVYTAGDLNSGLLGTIQVYTANFESNNNPQWDFEYIEGDNPADTGHAIALDAAGIVYVGGSVGTDTDARDGVLIRFTANGALTTDADFVGPAGGNDEILDIAVDPTDGSIYAVGYETVSGQGENMWIRKYVYNATFNEFNSVWTRTHHGGFGNDRAISCAISGNNLVVAGFETNSTGQTKLVLRVYER